MPIARSGYLILGILSVAVLLPLLNLLLAGGLANEYAFDWAFWQSRYLRRVLSFSLWQAFLSTLLSVGLAIVVARSLAHQGRFMLRGLLLKLFALPLVVPSIVAVMGIVSVYGASGWLPLGQSLYGLNGILLAHLFFNLPLAVRLLLPVWQSIPMHHWQMSEQLGFSSWHDWKYLEWPALREHLPGILLLVFMLCLTSFAVVLTLGGGPASTTLEVAIYQSLRFDFDPPKAVILALIQFCLCLIVAWASSRFHKIPEVEITLSLKRMHLSGNRPVHWRYTHAGIIFLAAIFVSAPLLATLVDALKGPLLKVLSNPGLWQSTFFTLLIGFSAASLSVVSAWMLVNTSTDLLLVGQRRKSKLIELAGAIVFVVPPLVIGTGLFVLMSPWLNVFDWAIPVVILINSMMGLPFAIRTLGPAMRQNKARYNKLCQSLAISRWNRFKRIDWPMLRKPVGLSAALVAALSMGDLGVIALFGSPDTTTLPLRLYHQLGAYRVSEAAVTAVTLLFICLSVFWLLEAGIGGSKRADD